MRLRATSPLLEGWTVDAVITTRHPTSYYGRPVLLIGGEAVGPIQADWAGYEILEATAAELDALRHGYYHFANGVEPQESPDPRSAAEPTQRFSSVEVSTGSGAIVEATP